MRGARTSTFPDAALPWNSVSRWRSAATSSSSAARAAPSPVAASADSACCASRRCVKPFSSSCSSARLEKATEDFEHVQLLRNIFAYLELAATASSTYIYYIEETEDYGDYEAVKAAYIPRILEVVELMEANDADVPFEGTLDAVGLLDGLLEQAMEGLNLLGGE